MSYRGRITAFWSSHANRCSILNRTSALNTITSRLKMTLDYGTSNCDSMSALPAGFEKVELYSVWLRQPTLHTWSELNVCNQQGRPLVEPKAKYGNRIESSPTFCLRPPSLIWVGTSHPAIKAYNLFGCMSPLGMVEVDVRCSCGAYPAVWKSRTGSDDRLVTIGTDRTTYSNTIAR